jgi:D-3-phosphoglycerate dehydrogenase
LSVARDKIFVNDTLGAEARRILADFDVYENEADAETLSRCVAALVWPFRMPAEKLVKMTRLRAVQTMSAGVDTLRFASIPAKVAIFSNAGAYAETVGEHAWSLALGAAKGNFLRNIKVVPRVLRDGTLLVLGCGAIGCEVARLARVSLSMRTVGVSRSFTVPGLFDATHSLSQLPDVVGLADLIVITLPLTVTTRALVNYDLLRRTKEAVVIVNVGRGDVVEENSMLRILRERPETRYATDVFPEKEGREVFDTTLWTLPNFSGTLHTAGSSGGREAIERVQARAAENLRSFLTRGEAANRVDVAEYVRH